MLARSWVKVIVAAVLGAPLSVPAFADGPVISQIYQPYVQPLEKEIEYMMLVSDSDPLTGSPATRHMLGYGASLSDRLYLEANAVYRDGGISGFEVLEFEGVYQLTEQGEYGSDWGILLESEFYQQTEAYEATVGILNNYEMGRWQFTSNLLLMYEWGEEVADEFETAYALQTRYRLGRQLEPTVELFIGQNELAVGPGLTGQYSMGGGRGFTWNTVLLFGADQTPDVTLKLEIEYEFF